MSWKQRLAILNVLETVLRYLKCLGNSPEVSCSKCLGNSPEVSFSKCLGNSPEVS